MTAAAKVLAVLGCFDQEHPHLHLGQLATRSGLALSTTHRIVAELLDWGALERRPDGSYVIGRRVWNLGLLAPVQAELRVVAAPYLHDLHAATKATVQLAVLDGDKTLYVDRVSGRHSVPIVSEMGTRLPLHATGVGKVLLAHADATVVAAAFADLGSITQRTVVDPARLSAQLAGVRAEGYATTGEEMSPGASSVAVPVCGPDRRVIAAVGLVVAPFAPGTPVLASMVTALRVTTAGIERQLSRQGTER